MANTWDDIREEAVDAGVSDLQRIERLARLQLDRVRAHRLAEIRKRLGVNQAEVAETMRVSQSRVSRVERGELENSQVATLQSYVRALGGEIEVVARFGNERIVLAS